MKVKVTQRTPWRRRFSQQIRQWTVVRRNLGHDCMNKKSLLAHIRDEQTDAVPANLVNDVNDVGKEKDTPSKRISKLN